MPCRPHSLQGREQLAERLEPYRRQSGLVDEFEVPLGLYLQASPPREIVARMLRNLKEIHRAQEDWGRMIAVQDRLLRIDGALGPLQELATKGVLIFMINTGGDGATQLSVEYRVTGTSDSALDTLAPQVDRHRGAQVARLVRYINTGNPEQPLVATPTQQASDVRAALLHAWATQAADEKSAAPKKADIPPKPAKKP